MKSAEGGTQMGLLDEILDSNGGAISQIARQLGIPEGMARQAVSALTPAIARGLQKNASQPGGLDSLVGALGAAIISATSMNPRP